MTSLFKNSSLNNSKFSSGFATFKHDQKNKLSEYFSPRFWDSQFYAKKEKFSMYFPKNASKQEKGLV